MADPLPPDRDSLGRSGPPPRDLLDNAESGSNACLTVTGDGIIVAANAAAETMFGYAPAELVGQNITAITAESDRDGVTWFFGWLRSCGDRPPKEISREVMRQHKDGTLFATTTRVSARAVANDLVVTVTCRDVSQERAAQQALRDSEENLRALMNAPTDAAVLVDRDGIILALNNTATARLHEYVKLVGHPTGQGFVGRCVYDLFPPELRLHRRSRNEAVFRTGRRASYEDERDGQWTHNTIDPVIGPDGSVVRLAVFSRDITQRKRDEERLRRDARELQALNRHLAETMEDLQRSQAALADKSAQLERTLASELERASHDPLTGALNHGAISDALDASIASHRRCAIAMVDVDGMKAANDTYGHQLGDAVLVSVAKILNVDGAVVGRYGGDEFLLILPGADSSDAGLYRERAYATLAGAQVIDEQTGASFPVMASIGVVAYPEAGADAKRLLDAADAAMYAEKRARRATGAAGFSPSRRVADRGADVTGELLPILASAIPLEDKLHVVAHQLAVTCGYDAVNVDVYEDGQERVATQNAFAKAPDHLLEAWDREQRRTASHPLGPIMEAARRPLVFDDIAEDQRITPTQRSLLSAAGIQSGIVAPLIWQDTIVGLIAVGSRRALAFSADDCELLNAIAARITPLVRMSQHMDHLVAQVASSDGAPGAVRAA